MIFKKFFNLFNIPGHIKRFFLRRKIKKYTTTKEVDKSSFLLKVINLLIYIATIGAITYVGYLYRENEYFIYGSIGVTLLLIILLAIRVGKRRREDARGISQLILENEDNKKG